MIARALAPDDLLWALDHSTRPLKRAAASLRSTAAAPHPRIVKERRQNDG